MKIAGLMYSSRRSLIDPQHLEERLDGIRRAMQLTRRLGTEPLLIRCGRIPDPQVSAPPTEIALDRPAEDAGNPFAFAAPTKRPAISDADRFSLLCEILNDLAGHASHLGCRLQLLMTEFHLNRIQTLINAIPSGGIQLVFDPATCLMTGSQPVSVFRDLYQHVGYIRARDADKDVDGAGIETAPGAGSVDWEELLPTFAEADFPGWICVERTGGDNRAEDVSCGVTRFRQLAPLPPSQ
ncbi:MAG: sugar phosphate isomerase/epimerase [Planctomycetaceae bacterium]|nr:sugar phosphate isomerase/epimerase [Planctomycetaceae bacterium]